MNILITMRLLQFKDGRQSLFQTKTNYLTILVLLLMAILVLGTIGSHLPLQPSPWKVFLFIGDGIGIVGMLICLVLILKGKAISAGWLYLICIPLIFFFHMVFGDMVSTDTLTHHRVTESMSAAVAYFFFISLFAFSVPQILAGVVSMLAMMLSHIYVIGRFHYDSEIPGDVKSFFFGIILMLCSTGFVAVLATRMNQRALNTVESSKKELEELVSKRTIELKQAKEEAEKQARTDLLSGLHNRRSFFELGEKELSRSLRFGLAITLVMIDIDHFKHVNDSYGHHAGDEAIKMLAHVLMGNLREFDISARIGGEEFALLLPQTDLDDAIEIAERLRNEIEKTDIMTEEGNFKITISAGVTSLKEKQVTLGDLLSRADQALYKAKRTGRNRVEKQSEDNNN